MSSEYTMEDFFKLHRDLPREGPGEPADVVWAASLLEMPTRAQIADVGCGSGGDVAALLETTHHAHVTALDQVPHFVQAVREAWRGNDSVTVLKADMATIANQYDLIWCAGAIYFMGVEEALTAWRKALRPSGAIAFSQACWFTDARSDRAQAYWAREYPQMTDEVGLSVQIAAAGYEIIGQRRLSDAAWQAYFDPIAKRSDALRAQADVGLLNVLDEAEEEAACWYAHRHEYGYVLSVVRPL